MVIIILQYTYPTITKNTFDNILVNLPPLEYQEKISIILSNIDDLIEVKIFENNNFNTLFQKTLWGKKNIFITTRCFFEKSVNFKISNTYILYSIIFFNTICKKIKCTVELYRLYKSIFLYYRPMVIDIYFIHYFFNKLK